MMVVCRQLIGSLAGTVQSRNYYKKQNQIRAQTAGTNFAYKFHSRKIKDSGNTIVI
jgi:hypothetical protein